MQSKLEKNLKHFLKKKVSINLSIIVSFFISGNIIVANNIETKHNKNIKYEKIEEIDYGNGETIEIKGESSNIKFNNSSIIKGNFNTSEFNYEGDKYSYGGLSSWGNGLLVDTISKEKNNNTFSLNNSGLIIGNFYADIIRTHHFPSGNGVLLYGYNKYEFGEEYQYPINNVIGDITNTGIIQGSYKNNEYKIPEDDSMIYNYAGSGNGNGIMFYFSRIDTPDFQKINSIINTGIISGYSEALPNPGYNGNGILVSNLEKLDNKGEISGNSIIKSFASNSEVKFWGLMSFSNGNGVVARYFPNLKINNSGKIIGKSVAGNFYPNDSIAPWPYYDGNGNGIYFNDNYNERGGKRGTGENSPLEVNNSGVVSGNAKYDAKTDRENIISHYYSNGNGIAYEALAPDPSVFNTDHKIELNIENSGLIKGYYSGDRIFNILSDDGRHKYLESRLAKVDGSGILFVSELKESNVEINNNGLVSGNTDKKFGNGISLFSAISAYDRRNSSSELKSSFNIKNSGVILGKENAIYLDKAEAQKKEIPNENIKLNIDNYGVLVGKNLVFVNNEKNNNDNIVNSLENDLKKGLVQYKNKGLGIKLDDDGKVIEVEVGEGGKITEDGEYKDYEIINTLTEKSEEFDKTILSDKLSSENKLDKLIINGVNKGLEVNSDFQLSNSILNSYGVSLILNSDKEFKGDNVVINGGGLRGDSEKIDNKYIAIEGKENSNLILQNNSIVNGDIDFSNSTIGINNILLGNSTLNGNFYSGAGTTEFILDNTTINGKIDLSNSKENSLIIKNDTVLNGDLVGNKDSKNDKLTFDSTSNINLYNKITDFDNINFTNNSQVTIYETAEISGSGEIKINEGNQINLRVDGSKKDSNDRVIGHALNNFEGNINGTTSLKPGDSVSESGSTNDSENIGVFNIITNGLGLGATIDFSGINFDENNLWVKTDSILDRAEVDKDNQSVIIQAEKDIFDIEAITDIPDNNVDKNEKLYIKLNEIYKGIYTSGKNNFEALKEILYLNPDIVGNGDYTTVTEEQQLSTLLAYLKEIYTDTPYSFSAEASRKSLNLFSNIVKENNFKAKDNEIITFGGLTHNNGITTDRYYGKNYHGFDIGSIDTDVDTKITGAYGQLEKGLSDNTSIGLILGGNTSKVNILNSNLKGASGYLGGYLKEEKGNFRGILGLGIQYTNWDSNRVIMLDSYKENYSDKGLNIYAEGKYSKKLGDKTYLEPKAGISYDYIKQEKISESQEKNLALKIDEKSFESITGNIGVDLRRENITDLGKHNLSGSINYTRILNGADENNLSGSFGGNNFDILVPQKTKDNLNLSIKYDLELNNGVMLGGKLSYDVPFEERKANHTHRDKGNWTIGIGIGYRFNKLNDLNPLNLLSASTKEKRNIKLEHNSYFEFNESKVNNEERIIIKNISEKINKNELSGKLKIEGHSDSSGSKEYNQKLSERRAKSVEDEFKKNITIDNIQYDIKSYGEEKPVAENTTEEGRAKNRRVSIQFEEN